MASECLVFGCLDVGVSFFVVSVFANIENVSFKAILTVFMLIVLYFNR